MFQPGLKTSRDEAKFCKMAKVLCLHGWRTNVEFMAPPLRPDFLDVHNCSVLPMKFCLLVHLFPFICRRRKGFVQVLKLTFHSIDAFARGCVGTCLHYMFAKLVWQKPQIVKNSLRHCL